MLSLSNVHYDVQTRKGLLKILKGISFTARAGEVTALLGPNGAGKTTTLSIAQGIQQATSGNVSLLGKNPHRAGPELRSQVGVMLQEGGLPMSVTGHRLLSHLERLYKHPASVDRLIDRLQLSEFKDRKIRHLSGGQKQRIGLAAALIGRPQVVFFDEPSAGLDPSSRRIVFELIEELKALGVCIILTTHLLGDAQRLADHVVLIRDGCVEAAGSVAELTRTDLHPPLGFTVKTRLSNAQLEDFPVEFTLEHAADSEIGSSWNVHGIQNPTDLHTFTTWLMKHDLMPTTMGLHEKSLEDVFWELTSHDVS